MVVFTQSVTRDMPEPQRTQFLNARRALLTALDEAGARILAGTDAGYLVPAGTSLHDELAELREAGLTPFEALSAATRSAGEYLGDPTLGVIAVGARADLVLVAENPLENLATLRTPAGVMLRGSGSRTRGAARCGLASRHPEAAQTAKDPLAERCGTQGPRRFAAQDDVRSGSRGGGRSCSSPSRVRSLSTTSCGMRTSSADAFISTWRTFFAPGMTVDTCSFASTNRSAPSASERAVPPMIDFASSTRGITSSSRFGVRKFWRTSSFVKTVSGRNLPLSSPDASGTRAMMP